MMQFVLKRWFLLLLMAGLSLAYLMPGKLQPVVKLLDPKIIVPLALFLMAWGLESRSFWSTLRRPWPALWAATLSYTLLPILALTAGPMLTLIDFRIGLVVTASVPCTLASATLWTRMAGGNEATSLLVTLITTAISWLATTAWLIAGTGTQTAINTAGLMLGLVLALVLPVAAGQMLQAVPPLARFAVRHKTGWGVISQLLVFCVILRAAVGVFDRLQADTTTVEAGPVVAIAFVCLAIHLVGLIAGFWTSRALRFGRADQIAVSFACSQKSLPVALFLYEAYFQGYPLAVIPMAFFHVGQLIVDTFIADRLSERSTAKRQMSKEIQVLS
jgi:solute carrier family 10 (sodium/bile acid cotransporter), member 7